MPANDVAAKPATLEQLMNAPSRKIAEGVVGSLLQQFTISYCGGASPSPALEEVLSNIAPWLVQMVMNERTAEALTARSVADLIAGRLQRSGDDAGTNAADRIKAILEVRASAFMREAQRQ